MTISDYLSAMTYGGIAMVATVLIAAIAITLIFYIYKAVGAAVRNQPQVANKIKKAATFRKGDKPAISMVKQERGRIAVAKKAASK